MRLSLSLFVCRFVDLAAWRSCLLQESACSSSWVRSVRFALCPAGCVGPFLVLRVLTDTCVLIFNIKYPEHETRLLSICGIFEPACTTGRHMTCFCGRSRTMCCFSSSSSGEHLWCLPEMFASELCEIANGTSRARQSDDGDDDRRAT